VPIDGDENLLERWNLGQIANNRSGMHAARLAAPALIALLAGIACGLTGTPGSISAADVLKHPEASLTYPGSYHVSHSAEDESDGGGIVPGDAHPAGAATAFYTSDRLDRVIAWYDAWLQTRQWLDAQDQGNGDRRWERGAHEDFFVSCAYQLASGGHACTVAYTLRAARFKASNAAAPPIGNPVSVDVVQQRHVALAATEDRVQYISGPPIPVDGTPQAAAARAKWSTNWCCASPVIVDDAALAEDGSGPRSAYHAVVLEVAEYDRPDVEGGAAGSLERNEMQNLLGSGFVLENVGQTTLGGLPAAAFVYERGLREAVILSIAYGKVMTGGLGTAYRVATLRIVYDVAPSSCDLSRSECFGVLAGSAGATWFHA
jgi:hypothetical protein